MVDSTWEKIKPYITLTNIIYCILLSFSCYMLINYLTDMVDGSDVKREIGLFAICLDVGAQYVFITALTEWNQGKWKKGIYKHRLAAIILLLIFGLYETCFAIPSSISFFLVQVDKKEKANQAIITQVSDNRDKLKDLNDELVALNIGLAAEAKTGVRQYSQNIIDRKKELQKKRDEIESSDAKTAKIINKIAASAVNSFDVTADTFGIPKKRAKVFTFGIAIFLLRVLMILFCLKIQGRSAVTTVKEVSKSTSSDTLLEKNPEEVLLSNSDNYKKELLQFTEALFGDNKKLNGDPVVSQKTGIPPERCAKYRKYLSELHIGDTPVISKRQGGSISNFPKEVIQNFIIEG